MAVLERFSEKEVERFSEKEVNYHLYHGPSKCHP